MLWVLTPWRNEKESTNHLNRFWQSRVTCGWILLWTYYTIAVQSERFLCQHCVLIKESYDTAQFATFLCTCVCVVVCVHVCVCTNVCNYVERKRTPPKTKRCTTRGIGARFCILAKLQGTSSQDAVPLWSKTAFPHSHSSCQFASRSCSKRNSRPNFCSIVNLW